MVATDITPRRLSHWFIAGSLALHLGLALLLVNDLPLLPWTAPAEPGPPLVVTILDPDAVAELPLGPVTNLPSTPKGLPRSMAPSAPATRPNATDAPAPRAPAVESHRRPPQDRPADESASEPSPRASGPPADGAESLPRVENPPSPAAPPGLPFVDRQELAKLFTEESNTNEPYAVNTEDLQYLSYIAKIARMLELVWQYPKEAGVRGQQGVTVLKVTIREDGALHEVALLESSGYPMLDGEALRAIKKIAPYPPLPERWHRSEWNLTISFTYLLTHVAVNVI
ncbi:MAG: TonB family protein [Nitrospirota bacterium]